MESMIHKKTSMRKLNFANFSLRGLNYRLYNTAYSSYLSKKFKFWISVITKNGIKSGAAQKKMEGKLSDRCLGQAINGVMIAPVSLQFLSWNKVVRSFLKIADFFKP